MADSPKPKQKRRSSIDKNTKAFRASVYSSSVTMEGFLDKKSSGAMGRYQKRYFTLAGHYLKYYEVRQSVSPPFHDLSLCDLGFYNCAILLQNDQAKDDALKGTIDIGTASVIHQTGSNDDKIYIDVEGALIKVELTQL